MNSIKINNRKIILHKSVISFFLILILAVFAVFGRAAAMGRRPMTASAATSSASSLSMVEINDSFGVMMMRTSAYKTIVYVERLYFDYNALSSLRLGDGLDCAVQLTNESGEWAKVGGWVKSEEGVRPGDSSGKIGTLYFLELRQYWEWRTFTNEERWTVAVNDGYNICEFTFDRGRDGSVYFIDGVYGLPEQRYPQVAEWYDLNNANADFSQSVRDYADYALDAVESLEPGQPLNLEPQPYSGRWMNTTPAAADIDGRETTAQRTGATIEPAIAPGWGLFLLIVAVVFLVKGHTGHTDTSVPPGAEEISPEIQAEYEENKPVLTEPERAELDKHKEFSLDNDAPTGQKLVKLKVLDDDGVQQAVYDENGSECFVNRKTHTVGNSVYALIDRKSWLLIRFNPGDMSLSDTAGNRITVNADRKIMNMDGVQCLSPISRDDVLQKLSDMGKYTSQYDPARLMFRMDDDNALKVAMGEKSRNPVLDFFGTIGAAFKNVFGGGDGSKGFLSGLLDVLIMLGVLVIGGFAVYLIVLLVIQIIKKVKS